MWPLDRRRANKVGAERAAREPGEEGERGRGNQSAVLFPPRLERGWPTRTHKVPAGFFDTDNEDVKEPAEAAADAEGLLVPLVLKHLPPARGPGPGGEPSAAGDRDEPAVVRDGGVPLGVLVGVVGRREGDREEGRGPERVEGREVGRGGKSGDGRKEEARGRQEERVERRGRGRCRGKARSGDGLDEEPAARPGEKDELESGRTDEAERADTLVEPILVRRLFIPTAVAVVVGVGLADAKAEEATRGRPEAPASCPTDGEREPIGGPAE